MTIIKSLTTAAVAGAALLGTASAGIIDITTTTDTVLVGETFEVRIVFSSETDDEFLGSADFGFDFDSELFDFVSADFTDPVTGVNQLDLPGDPSPIGGGVFEVAEGTGLADLLVTAISGNDFAFLQDEQADDFTVVTLTFVAEMIGTGDLGLSMATSNFFDVFGAPDAFPEMASILNGVVSVTVSEVPLPGAAVFLLTGAAGLFARRRMAA